MLEADGDTQQRARDGQQLIELVGSAYQLDREGHYLMVTPKKLIRNTTYRE